MSTIYSVKIVLLLAFFTGYCFAGPMNNDQAQSVKRVKRHLWQFKNMINCATGRSSLAYAFYGCHCGWGGSSAKPVDDTDECCEIHDDCYKKIKDDGICSWFGPKLEIYDRSGCTGCASSNDNCELRTCECDGAAARCFARSNYNPKYKYWFNWWPGNC